MAVLNGIDTDKPEGIPALQRQAPVSTLLSVGKPKIESMTSCSASFPSKAAILSSLPMLARTSVQGIGRDVSGLKFFTHSENS